MKLNRLLNDILIAEGLRPDERHVAEKLRYLRPYLKDLRKSYKTLSQVSVDYSNKSTQLAYLIGYYPYYAEATFEVLSRLSPKLHSELEVSLVGGGCCPEIFSILKYMQVSSLQLRFSVKSYDIYAREWEFSRSIARKNTQSYFQSSSIKHDFIKYDFTKINQSQISEISKGNFIIFQNCFNEADPSTHSSIIKNVENILVSSLKNKYETSSKKHILVVDFSGYGEVKKLFNEVHHTAVDLREKHKINSLGIIRDDLNLDLARIRSGIPEIISNELLTGESGLIARRNLNLTYMYFKI